MKTKKCTFFILIFGLLATSVTAQENLNVNCVTQFYHNWSAGVSDVAVRGDYAYLACETDGLRIVNIAEFGAFADVARLAYGLVTSVALHDNLLLACDDETGVHVLDLTQPDAPQEVSLLPHGNLVKSVDFKGSLAYLATSGEGVQIYDLSNPALPVQVGEISDMPYVEDVDVAGDIVYTSCEWYGLRRYDLSDMSAPALLDSFIAGGGEWVNGASIGEGYAYVACGWAGLKIVDLATMESVAQIDSLSYAFGTELAGNIATVHYGNPECPLAFVDVTNPLNPQTQGVYFPPEELIHHEIVDQLVYVADYRHGMRVVDFSVPLLPYETAAYSRIGEDLDVIVRENLAYVREDNKLKLIDIANPAEPVERGYHELNWGFNDLQVQGNTAYLVTFGHDAVHAVDVSDPDAPTLLGVFHSADYDAHYRMAIYGSHGYLAENDGLRILDLGNPADMQQIGYYERWLGNAQIHVHEHYLLLEGSGDQLLVLDLTNPAEPEEVTSVALEHGGYNVALTDSRLYVGNNAMVSVFSIEDITHPAPLGSITFSDDFNSSLHSLEARDNYLYVSFWSAGIAAYDVTDVSSPQLVGYFDTPGKADGIEVMGTTVYLADRDNFGIYEFTGVITASGPASPAIAQSISLRNYPNPFNATTEIRFDVPMRAQVRLTVYDVLGRQVALLADRQFDAGSFALTWNGQDATGRGVASGKYFVRLAAGDELQTRPIVLLK